MSDYEVRDGDVSLFENDKEGNDKRPDFTGYAIVDGTKMNVSLWIKNSGKLRFSGRIEEPRSDYPSKGVKEHSNTTAVPF
jgi:hypothetical protein